MQETIGEVGSGRFVEQIRRIRQRRRHSGFSLFESELQVELSQCGVELDCSSTEAGHFERRLTEVLERQRHLEQRMTSLRTNRIENLHHTLERNIRMRERLQIHLTRRSQQLGKRHRRINLGTQHQGIDEHTDHVIELGFTTTRDRGTDRNVGRRGQSCQQHRQSRVNNHERSCVRCLGQFVQLGPQLRFDGETVIGAAP